jgi:hypothetical protein
MFIMIHRFRVKLEVTNGKSTGVFVLFDSDMNYIMEKSYSFFVAQSKVTMGSFDDYLFGLTLCS